MLNFKRTETVASLVEYSVAVFLVLTRDGAVPQVEFSFLGGFACA